MCAEVFDLLKNFLDKRRNVFLLAAFAVFMESLTSPCLKIGSNNYEPFSAGYFFWFGLAVAIAEAVAVIKVDNLVGVKRPRYRVTISGFNSCNGRRFVVVVLGQVAAYPAEVFKNKIVSLAVRAAYRGNVISRVVFKYAAVGSVENQEPFYGIVTLYNRHKPCLRTCRVNITVL